MIYFYYYVTQKDVNTDALFSHRKYIIRVKCLVINNLTVI